MKNTAQKKHSSTQSFTEIVDIVDNIVLLHGGSACTIIEITASNFALLSEQEQNARIYAYASLLNSLSFPIQILIRNKRIDISSYLKDLDAQELATKNMLLKKHIEMYRSFITEMISVNVVLNKAFYIAIPFSSLEAGFSGVGGKNKGGKSDPARQTLIEAAEKSLSGKSESLLSQLGKLSLQARLLEKEELVKLFYDIFNGLAIQGNQAESDVNAPLVKAGKI